MSLTNRLARGAAALALAVAFAAAVAAPGAQAQEGGLETQIQDNQDGGLQTQQGGQTQGQAPGQTQGQGQGQAPGQGQVPTQGQGQPANMETTQYDDWVVQCRQQQGQTGPCRMGQGVRSNESQQEVMRVIVGNPPNNPPVINFLVPLGVNLRAPVTVKVDGSQIGTAQYFICNQQSCIAQMQIDNDQLAAMKAGRRLQVTLTGTRGKSRDVPASLLGFTDAWNALNS
jgi:invasion protein IalB